jgi:UDP-2,3-diacylglucosamine hydrolase
MAETLFISDLHLSPERPRCTALFEGLLAGRARQARRLYILGDLFDTWIGDDDDAYQPVLAALTALTAAGVTCGIQRGNRDFLLGRRFARRTGCTLLPDRTVIRLGDAAVLLMHGDLLCTDDVPYQRFRRKVRNPLVQRLFLLQPLPRRRRIAADYRRKSGAAMSQKPAEIMDVNPTAVQQALRAAGARELVHGHTHRPADHRLTLDGSDAMRRVLADWSDERGEVLVHADGAWRREPVAHPMG